MKIVSIHKNLIILNLYHEYKNNHPSIFLKKVSLEGPLTCCARHILATKMILKIKTLTSRVN